MDGFVLVKAQKGLLFRLFGAGAALVCVGSAARFASFEESRYRFNMESESCQDAYRGVKVD